MTSPAAGEVDLWCVVHVPHQLRRRHPSADVDLTGVFFRWDLAVEWAARNFPNERQADVLPLELLALPPADLADGEAQPIAWALCRRGDPSRELVAAVGPFLNYHLALADLAEHLDRYGDHLVAAANFVLLEDSRLTGEGLPPPGPGA